MSGAAARPVNTAAHYSRSYEQNNNEPSYEQYSSCQVYSEAEPQTE